jgi:hypothetical protein
MFKNKNKESLEFERSSFFTFTIGAEKTDTLLQTVVQDFNMNCFAKFRQTRKKCTEKLGHLTQLLFSKFARFIIFGSTLLPELYLQYL